MDLASERSPQTRGGVERGVMHAKAVRGCSACSRPLRVLRYVAAWKSGNGK